MTKYTHFIRRVSPHLHKKCPIVYKNALTKKSTIFFLCHVMQIKLIYWASE